MKATLHHTRQLTDDIRSFFFETEKQLDYTAGQFIELTIHHDSPDSRGHRRWFTVSSSPGTDYITVTTRIPQQSASTFKRALAALQPGQSITMSDALGDFVLPKQTDIPLIFVAGGIGITPFHSISQRLANSGNQRNIHLMYAVAHEDDIIFQETFEAAGIPATIIVSEPSAFWGGERGHVSAQMILGLRKPPDNALLYLSGPEPMIEQLQKDLVVSGVSKRQIVTDFFPGYTSL